MLYISLQRRVQHVKSLPLTNNALHIHVHIFMTHDMYIIYMTVYTMYGYDQ